MSIIDTINKPQDIKKLNIQELELLAKEVRDKILSTVKNNGGHLASSLGTVDLIISVLYVFDFPTDKIIFDVGHQAYAYKILTDRKELFETIRKDGGISGFPDINESEYDFYSSGHAGSSISAGLGYCVGRDLLGEDYFVISVVGDGSLFNGLSMEAITHLDKKPDKFLIILNDNGMSISENNSALYKSISKITTRKNYSKTMSFFDRTIGNMFIGRLLKRFKHALKRTLSAKSIVSGVGLNYVGVFDGNNIKTTISLLDNIKNNPRPTLLHLKTVKGKGYVDAENFAETYHGVGKGLIVQESSYSKVLDATLTEMAKNNDKIVALTAAMKDGTGLVGFAKNFPKRFFDVGIAEEHSVTCSAGMALGGLKPYVCIYSTFLQRAYDQIMADVCIQNLPVVFCIDRAGFVGSDGKTHQGLYDLSYLRSIPNLTILCPKDTLELKQMLKFSENYDKPLAIRYSNGKVYDFDYHTEFSLNALWESNNINSDVAILAVGNRCLSLATKICEKTQKQITVINARSVKPIDEKLLKTIKVNTVITLEENNINGGFGSAISEYYSRNDKVKVYSFGVDDRFVSHSTVEKQMEYNGLSVENVIKVVGL